MKTTITTGAVLCTVLAGIHPRSVVADEVWHPDLENPPQQRNYRKPTESFRFTVPANLSVEYLRRVTLELDDVDMTSLIRREANYAIFTSPEPLQYGNHRMRIVYYAPDGNIEELGSWNFEVRQSQYYRQAILEGNTNIGLTHKLADQNIIPAASDSSINGAANVSGAMAGANWQVTGQTDLIGNSNYEAMNLRRNVDVGNFLFTGKGDNFTLNAGHHSIVGNSLILDSLNTRGVSATLANAKQTYSASAYAMRATPINGFEHGLGVTDSDNRIDGAIVSAFPFSDHPEQQFLSLAYVQGRSSNGVAGVAVSGDTYAREGDAWDLVSESTFQQQQMRLRLEYAKANLTATDPFAEVPIPTLSDAAYAILAEYQPHFESMTDTPSMWKIGLLHQYVGRDFSSIANVSIPRDKQLWQLSGEYNRAAFYAKAGISSEFNNVRRESYIPQVRTDRINYSMQYAPQLEFKSNGQPNYGMLGQQSYLISFISAQSKDADYPGSTIFAQTDFDTVAVNLSGSFNYENWSWSISHAIGFMRDHTGMQPNTDTSSDALSGSWRIGGSFTLVPNLQFNSNKFGGIEYKTNILSVDMSMQLWDGKLAMHLGYSHTESRSSDDLQDVETEIYQPSIEWRVIASSLNKPGATLRLSGIFTGTTDNIVASNTFDSYQTMLTAVIGLPFGL